MRLFDVGQINHRNGSFDGLKCLLAMMTIFSLIYVISANSSTNQVRSKLDIELKATWKETSLLMEAFEYFSDKLPENKISFLKSIPCEKVDQVKNDRNSILTLAQQSKATGAEVSLLDFALDTRHYSPRVKVQYTKNINTPKSSLNTIISKNVEDIEFLDHTFNTNSESKQINFIYSDITTKEGCSFVRDNIDSVKPIVLRLVRLDSTGSIDKEEMIKEKYMQEASTDLLSIRGYGVELQIKNMEYKQTADDDVVSGNDTFYKGVNFNKLKKNYSHLSNDLDTLKLHIQQSDSKSEKLKVWEMKYFGVQAMKKISDQPTFDEKIKMLQDISQNFPSYMKELKNTAFENNFKDELQTHLAKYDGEFKSRNPNNPQEVIRRNSLFLNGLELDLTKLSIFSLFEIMDKELKLVKSLTSNYHLTSSSVNSVLFTPSTASKDLRFKFSSELEQQIIWFNNVEGDGYGNFPRELKSMLYPTMYGQMRFVKRNLFNVVYILDPASTQKQVVNLLYILGNIMNRGYPIRIGALFVPKVSSSFVDVSITGSTSASPETVDELSLHAVSLLERMAKENRAIFPILREFMDRESFDRQFVDDLQKKFFGSVKLMSQNELITRYRNFIAMGFNVKTAPIIMVNGAVIQGDEQDSGDQLVLKGVREQYDDIKKIIEKNVIVDSDKNLLKKIINHYGGFDTFNSEIFDKKQNNIVSLGDVDKINFVQHPESGGVIKKTHIVCLGENQDVSSMVKEAISFVSENKKTRIGFLNIDDSSFASVTKYHSLYKPYGTNQLSGKNFCSKYFNTKESGIISMNGRTIPFLKLFTSKDFTILDAFEDVNSGITSVVESNSYSTVDPDIVTSDYLSDVLFGVSSVLKVYNQHTRQDLSHIRSNNIATLETESNPSAEIKLTAILNPLSKFAQKLSSMIRFVKEKLGKSVNLVIHLNPDLETSSLPLQSYYSYVLSGSSVAEFNTKFSDVKGRIFTMWMDVPESWLVDSTYAKEDLDNLKLDECASQKCYARFQLEYFVASGTCIDDNARPVRGLQLQLVSAYGTNATNVDDTTLVMANYGYFQLRASSPNIYTVKLPQGRHSEIYSIQSTKQVDFYSQSELQFSDGYGSADTKKFLVSVHSFDAPFARVVVNRNSGMEKEDLLAPQSSTDTGGWSSWLTGNSEEKKTIHIFSLASGLMYERLLKIMILSVRKHLKKSGVKVKFWFLKQFLSPSFKQFLPEYAKAYNFEYGLISYQWPHWLHKQQTKQRLIWAYKVLFLDVLFPLQEVNKIIFVDADQVCRTDMSELFFDLDMQGKALAYTPFCESRKEMDGYRFWKSGYWANHLGGRPYHISALYVVDIDMFRRNYHGDQFRMVYDNLARDPNSLSNLDQDLPNYAQHNVPIRSLPQEWLWCESWCSDESKAKAKTIDLCNNPQTKEHKLASAKRIIPEWTDYDNEIKDFQKKLVSGK